MDNTNEINIDTDARVSMFDDSEPPEWIGWVDSENVLFVSSGHMCLAVTKNMCLVNLEMKGLAADSRSVGVLGAMCHGVPHKLTGWRKVDIAETAAWLIREGWYEFVPNKYHDLFHVHRMGEDIADVNINNTWSPLQLFESLDDFLCE